MSSYILKPTIENILDFVAEYSGKEKLQESSDIEGELGVYADDWHDMIEKFGEIYQVDMTTYLWYFHSREEGFTIGSLFFKAPYERVERIPITPSDLLRIATKQKWDIKYPEHKIPNKRYDLIIGTVISLIIIILWIYQSF